MSFLFDRKKVIMKEKRAKSLDSGEDTCFLMRSAILLSRSSDSLSSFLSSYSRGLLADGVFEDTRNSVVTLLGVADAAVVVAF